MTRMPRIPGLTWNDANQLVRVDLDDGRTAFYSYERPMARHARWSSTRAA